MGRGWLESVSSALAMNNHSAERSVTPKMIGSVPPDYESGEVQSTHAYRLIRGDSTM